MGGGTYSDDTYYHNTRAYQAAGQDTFHYGETAQTVHPLLDPRRKASDRSPFADKIMRECACTDEHPDPTPIVIGLDVTASNSTACYATHKHLPQLFGTLKKVVTDPEIMIAAVGDANTDRFPLQVGDFESDNRVDDQIRAMILEMGGGGQDHETYDLLAYYLVQHTMLQPFYTQRRKAFCNTPDAPVWMSDGSFRPIGDILPGDIVMGWRRQHNRRCYTPSRVLAVQSRVADNVVEATMESGRKIKCTTDHRWLSAYNRCRHSRRQHNSTSLDSWTSVIPSTRGGNLSYVLTPTAPVTDDLKEEAAWLAGVYDGEGHDLEISQNATHNPDVCARIEGALTKLGFAWIYRGHAYYVLGGVQARTDMLNRLPITRRASLLKWLLESQNAKYEHLEVRSRTMHRKLDRVISVTPLAPQEVVSMQTDTGNYIAWGYASSNCFFIGDEMPYDVVRREQVKRIISDDIPEDIATTHVFAELQKQYDAYFLFQNQSSHLYMRDSHIMPVWRNLLGENALILDDPNNVCAVIAGIVAMRESGRKQWADIADNLRVAGFDQQAINSASHTLATVGK